MLPLSRLCLPPPSTFVVCIVAARLCCQTFPVVPRKPYFSAGPKNSNRAGLNQENMEATRSPQQSADYQASREEMSGTS